MFYFVVVPGTIRRLTIILFYFGNSSKESDTTYCWSNRVGNLEPFSARKNQANQHGKTQDRSETIDDNPEVTTRT